VRVLMVAMLVIGGSACRKKADVAPPVAAATISATPETKPIDPDDALRQIARNFRRVNFAFDSTNLVGESMTALAENAKILQDFAEVRVEIQGHADERGTTEYNLALGERRAQAVKSRLESMGVPSSRVTVVSYGKERPLASGSSETVWAQNRRAEFRVIQGVSKGSVSGTVQ
jgi:peptidoglycan-associated lipoprotein